MAFGRMSEWISDRREKREERREQKESLKNFSKKHNKELAEYVEPAVLDAVNKNSSQNKNIDSNKNSVVEAQNLQASNIYNTRSQKRLEARTSSKNVADAKWKDHLSDAQKAIPGKIVDLNSQIAKLEKSKVKGYKQQVEDIKKERELLRDSYKGVLTAWNNAMVEYENNIDPDSLIADKNFAINGLSKRYDLPESSYTYITGGKMTYRESKEKYKEYVDSMGGKGESYFKDLLENSNKLSIKGYEQEQQELLTIKESCPQSSRVDAQLQYVNTKLAHENNQESILKAKNYSVNKKAFLANIAEQQRQSSLLKRPIIS